MNCPACGEALNAGGDYCGNCGWAIPADADNDSE